MSNAFSEADPVAATPDLAPIARGERILALDALRGFAVLGILLMNITAFGLPWPAYYNPAVWGGHTGADLWAWITTEMLFEGTMRTVFSMLFGAGVIIFTTRAERKDPTRSADLFYRRTILLIAFGVVHAYVMLWAGDILYAYGMAGLFLFPLRRVSGRTLIVLGVCLALLPGAANNAVKQSGFEAARVGALEALSLREMGETLTHEQQSALHAWEEQQDYFDPTRESLEDSVARMRGSYATTFAYLVPINAYWQSYEYYTFGFWDAISMMLVGMGLMRLGVLEGRRSTRLYAAFVIVGYGAGLTINAMETRHIMLHAFTAESIFDAWWTYHLGRLCVAMGHIGLVMLLVRSGVLRGLMRRMAAVGQMALTNYLSQTVLCNLVFLGIGFGLFGQMGRASLYLVVLGVWIVQLLWSAWWLARFRFGPVEWLWRALTYGRAPSMRRAPQESFSPTGTGVAE